MNLVNWGKLEWQLDEFDRATEMIDEALALHRRVGQRWGIVKTLTDRANLHGVLGELDASEALLAEAAAMLHDVDMPDILGHVNFSRAQLAVAKGDFGFAARMLSNALREQPAAGYALGIEDAIFCAVELALRDELYTHALCLLGGCDASARRIGKVQFPLQQQKIDAHLAEARRQLYPADADAAWACGQAMSEEEMVAYALREVLEPIRTQR